MNDTENNDLELAKVVRKFQIDNEKLIVNAVGVLYDEIENIIFKGHRLNWNRTNIELLKRKVKEYVEYIVTDAFESPEDFAEKYVAPFFPDGRYELARIKEKLESGLQSYVHSKFLRLYINGRNSKQPHLIIDTHSFEAIANSISVPKSSSFEGMEIAGKFRNVLDVLSNEERVMLILHYIESYALTEIARIFGCSASQVRNQLRQAIEKLRFVLDKKLRHETDEGLKLAIDDGSIGHLWKIYFSDQKAVAIVR